MIHSAPLNCSASALVVESGGLSNSKSSRSSRPPLYPVRCSVARNNASNVPKLEPFSRNKLDRAVKEPPLIQKSENQIADYCLTLEGDESYSCWKAYFELKDLEKEAPRDEVERLIMEAGGVKSLIECVHGVSAIHKAKKEGSSRAKATNLERTETRPCPIPDGLPKTKEELEEEEKAMMPDSPFTRMLRARGTHPAWYTPAPEHETD